MPIADILRRAIRRVVSASLALALCSVASAYVAPGESSSASPSQIILPVCPTPGQTLKAITDVQNPSGESPLAGQMVAVRGVVTGDFQGNERLQGFFIQQPVVDSAPRVPQGIFIYGTAKNRVSVGQYVQVEGRVNDYKPRGDSRSHVEITGLRSVVVCGSGPAIAPLSLSLPLASANALDAYESTLVSFEQTLTVTDVNDLGHYGSLQFSRGRLYEPYNSPTQTPAEATAANALNRIVLDDGSTRPYPDPIPYLTAADSSGTRRIGDTISAVRGVLTHSQGGWSVEPVALPAFVAANPRPAAPAAVGGSLRVAHYNIQNFFSTIGSRGAASEAEFVRQRTKLVKALATIDADVLGLVEVENDGGVTAANLVTALNAEVGEGSYRYIDTGVLGNDKIAVAILYKPARVTPVGSPQVIPAAGFSVANGYRPSIAQRFAATTNGGLFWMVANHLKSKGGCPKRSTNPDADHGQGCWNAARTAQAGALRDWLTSLVSASGESKVLAMGDMNAYLDEDPLKLLRLAGYEDLLRRLPPPERYSYQFGGETGALDHAFVSPDMKSAVNGITVWHINAEEPPILGYTIGPKTDDRYAPTPYRSSDHDPVLVGLTLPAHAPVVAPELSAVLPVSGIAGNAVTISSLSATHGTRLVVSWGDGRSDTLPISVSSASHTYTAAGRYTITVTLSGDGLPAVRSGTIVVAARAG